MKCEARETEGAAAPSCWPNAKREDDNEGEEPQGPPSLAGRSDRVLGVEKPSIGFHHQDIIEINGQRWAVTESGATKERSVPANANGDGSP